MKHFLPLLVLFVLSYPSVRLLFSPGFFPMHDDTQPTRVQQMTKALMGGQFPVRWVPDLGYGFGYPIFNFYAPLPYYAGALKMLAGADALTATKLIMGLGMILAALSMYILATRIAGAAAGLMGGLLYLYAPYHAVNLYVRGAVGELWAYGFLPVLILGVYETLCGSKKRGLLCGAVGLAAILLSHNILGMITLMFFVIGTAMYALLYRKKKTVLSLTAIFLLGVGLSAFFTVPAFMEKGHTRVEWLTKGGSDFHQHFVYVDQLWDSPWGYAGSAPGRADGMSFKIGKLHLLLGIFAYGALLFYAGRNSSRQSYVISSWLLVVVLISVFLMVPASEFIWEGVPGFGYIQYPWRFLNLILLCLCILPVVVLSFVSGIWKWVAAAAVVIPVVMTNGKYFSPQYADMRTSAHYTDPSAIRFTISKISDEYMPKTFQPPETYQEIASDMLSGDEKMTAVSLLENGVTRKVYDAVLRDGTLVMAPVAYFPGWHAAVDGVPSDVVEKDGRVAVFIPAGRHILSLNFFQTPIEWMGNAISLLSLFLLGYVSLSGAALRHGEETDRRDRNTDL